MTTDQARRKYDSLRRMTTARGCTPHEASVAARLAENLAKRFGFASTQEPRQYRAGFDARYERAEARAAVRFAWEYRRCGKARCRCAGKGSALHGPYKYGKRREGKKVRSIYMGR